MGVPEIARRYIGGVWQTGVESEGGGSRPAAYAAVASSNPGAAAACQIATDLSTVTPVVSLMDGIQLTDPAALAVEAGTLIACCGNSSSPTFIGHDLSLIYRSTDKGATWTGIATPLDADIASAASLDSPLSLGGGVWYCVAVDGGTASILHSIDDGVTWATVTTTLPDTGLIGQLAYDGSFFYATFPQGGSPTSIWKTASFASWTEGPTGLVSPVARVKATPTVLIAGTNIQNDPADVGLAVSTDNGANFTLPTSGASPLIYPYDYITDGDGHWLGWFNSSADSGSSFVQSLDDGQTWDTDVVDAPGFVTLAALAFRSADGWFSTWGKCVSFGEFGSAAGFIGYSAPVASPLVWTPTGYAASNVQTPTAIVPVA